LKTLLNLQMQSVSLWLKNNNPVINSKNMFSPRIHMRGEIFLGNYEKYQNYEKSFKKLLAKIK